MIRLALLIIVLASTLPAVAGPTYDPEKNADEQMVFLDANGDGALTQEEFSRPRAGRFHHIDTDGDGVATLQEWMEFRPVKKIVAMNLMKRWDTNADNVVSRDEFLHSNLETFQNIDANHDQRISRKELVDHWTRKKQELDAYWQQEPGEH